GCANMSSNPSSDTSSTPEAFANSSSAASKRYPTNGQCSAPPITSQSSRHGHKLGAMNHRNRHLLRGKLGGYRDTLLGPQWVESGHRWTHARWPGTEDEVAQKLITSHAR